MRAPAVLVPFKGSRYKSRLAPILETERRKELAYLLLDDLLRTIQKAGLSRRCYVISSDSKARAFATRRGASFILERRASGVNGAVRMGVRRLKGEDRFLVLPSDLAMLSARDIEGALKAGCDAALVIAPSSSFNGTNLLLFPRRMASELSYDNNSFWNHLAAAARLRLRTAVLTSRGLVFDLDTPSDAREVADSRLNTSAAKLLRKWKLK